MKWLTVVIYMLGASSGYLFQLFDCNTPGLDPYHEDYDCFQRRVYFLQEAITGGSVGMMWLVYKFSKPKGWFKGFQIGMISFTTGGLLDMLTYSDNNYFTIICFIVFIASTIYYGTRDMA